MCGGINFGIQDGLFPDFVHFLLGSFHLLLDILFAALIPKTAAPTAGIAHNDRLEAGIHLIRGITDKVDQGCRAREQAALWHRQCCRYTTYTGNGDSGTIGVDGSEGFHVRDDISDFGVVFGQRYRADFGKTDLGAAVNHARIEG